MCVCAHGRGQGSLFNLMFHSGIKSHLVDFLILCLLLLLCERVTACETLFPLQHVRQETFSEVKALQEKFILIAKKNIII
jgi:hypothetical protein